MLRHLPPIGLSVYETYGKSESEQTLIGGETGLESGGRHIAPDSSFGDDNRRPVIAIVLPRCNRPELGRPCKFCPSDGCDCSEPIFVSGKNITDQKQF